MHGASELLHSKERPGGLWAKFSNNPVVKWWSNLMRNPINVHILCFLTIEVLVSSHGSKLSDRVWQAGGSAELAAKGKCWIDGICRSGPSWWLGSHDDSDLAYR
jgi:hypothetical protein